ncbi:hypothetical protein LY474_28375 [Myxococcus stipitatus]|uniref:hypothetical protein n=1 Tax=Myxococcus stipitatus TaxID=83455 RepID=UPI001F31583A|nr:hypothetical protein [Myxococcus stipitatus]MCE9671731.1 hypothetical protein [Myxococcus stipitatus]
MPSDIDLESFVLRQQGPPRYSRTASLEQVMDDLDFFASIDEAVEALRAKWSRRGTHAMRVAGISFAALVFGSFSGVFAGALAKVLGGTVVVSLIAALVCLSKNHGAKQRDLPNRRYELVTYLLRRLRKDIPADAPMTLNLDLTDPDAPDKQKHSGQAGEWTTTEYVDPWLQLQVRLADGTHLRLTMEEWLQKRVRTRRNYRGKLKTKHKSKGESVLGVQLRVKPERHPELVALEGAARRALKLPGCVTGTRLDVAEDRLSLSTRLPLDWLAVNPSERAVLPERSEDGYEPVRPNPSRDAQGRWVETVPDATRTFLMMLLSLYQVLNFSSRSQRESPRRAAP